MYIYDTYTYKHKQNSLFALSRAFSLHNYCHFFFIQPTTVAAGTIVVVATAAAAAVGYNANLGIHFQ